MRTTILCLAALAQLALNAVSADPITIPLYKRTDSGDIYKAAGKELSNGVLAGKVKIGTPAQEFVFAFDTTTGYSWVRGSRCKTENCRGRCTYYARKSSTAVSVGKKFSVEYGDSCVDTHVYTDKFEFAGLTVEDMPFGGAYRMSGFGTGFDGYLGLGRSVDFNNTKISSTAASSLAKRDTTLSDSAFVTNAFQSGSGISSAQFGMYTTSSSSGFDQSGSVTTTTSAVTNVTTSATTATTATTVTSGGTGLLKRSSSGDEEQAAGYLVIGGVDTSVIKGDVNYLRLADTEDGSAKNWDVCIRHAGFGDLRLEQEEKAIASISTSTSYISMPPDQADKFHAKFGGKYQSSTKNYLIKCSDAKKLPTLKMTLEDHIVELPPKYWIATVDADRDCCETKITRGSSDRDWVLGTSLTNAFYTSFDSENEKVGLAIKKGQEDDGLRVYKKSH
ncbi:aspartic peptidase domain-containing protein [Gilbertella persicaria]|uniref:aspartic peptidase domain-containing protein n=1 Tax=Gilbertella persicaria TaxID=101096 RepID=UPI00221FD3DD|nr:aspartic peptidase domain-containing protein [Gilbertella persicaria]KAI8090103.1 aspartic peptidase domain-containing protein [Gilbertella persicaria]